MAGTDEFDATSSTKELKFEDADSSKKYRIGIIKECFDHSGLDEEIRSHLQKIIQELKLKGHEIIDLSFPFIEYLVPTYYVLTTAEASSNLSRFDGVHFGYRSSEAKGVDETYIKSRSEGF